jgi:hypothetical protein
MKKALLILPALILALSVCATAEEPQPEKEISKDYRAIEALKGKGFKTCADAALKVLKFMHKNDDFAYLNTWNVKASDIHASSIFTVKSYSDGPSYASLTTSLTPDNRCDASFTQLFYFSDTCPKLRDTTFKEWKFSMDLGGVPVYEDPTSTSVVLTLAPMPNGCLVIKSGMFYFPPEGKKEEPAK